MRSIRAAFLRLRAAVTGENPDRDLAAELDSHLELHIDDNVRAGMSPAAARRAALLRLGGLDQTKERYRDRRSLPIIEIIARDFRDTWRRVRRTPRVAAAIVGTLALALGLNASTFAVADALMLRPFSFPEVDRIVVVEEIRPDWPWRGLTAPATFLEWQRRSTTLAFMSAMTMRSVELGDAEEPEQLRAAVVSANFFSIMATPPVVGREFLAEEEITGHDHSVVIGHGLWERRFRSDPAVVGQSIVLDGTKHSIVGVAPSQLDLFPFGAQVWLPSAFDAVTRHDARTVLVVGRLAEGHTVTAAETELAAVTQVLGERHPLDLSRSRVRVRTLTRGMAEEGSPLMHGFLMASSLFVLLIACANIANLLLAVGVERRREVAVRFALGASRAQILRGLWLESAWLALVAVPCALGVAYVALPLLMAAMPPQLAALTPGWDAIDVDGRLVAFTALLAAAAAAAFGVLPAFRASRPNPEALKEAGRGLTAGADRQRLRRGLIVAQLALVMPLLVAAVSVSRGTTRLLDGPQGYEPKSVLTLQLALPERAYPDADAQRRFVSSALDALYGSTGVRSAAVANFLPSGGDNFTRPVTVEGRAATDLSPKDHVEHRVISRSYFETLRIPLVQGRAFTDADDQHSAPVGIVSRSMADRHWPGLNPVGRRVRYADDPADAPWITVVGVAGNVIEDWAWGREQITLYRPYRQTPTRNVAVAVRTAGGPAAAAAQVRRSLQSVDPHRPILDVRTLEQRVVERLAAPRTISGLLTVLGALALAMAAIGLYSVISYVVSQRTHEIGLRLALGASPSRVLQSVFGEAARLCAAGIAVGGVLALAAGQLLEGLLSGIASTEPATLVVLTAGVAMVALAAVFFPARRAAAIEPSIALRQE